jgi:hypothetical protein
LSPQLEKWTNRTAAKTMTGTTEYGRYSFGQMISATPPLGCLQDYVYDGEGRRLIKTGSGTTATTFVYDFEKVLQEVTPWSLTEYTSTAEQYGTLLSMYDTTAHYYVADAQALPASCGRSFGATALRIGFPA